MQNNEQQKVNLDPIAFGNAALKDVNLAVINLVKIIEELMKQNAELAAALRQGKDATSKSNFKEFDVSVPTA